MKDLFNFNWRGSGSLLGSTCSVFPGRIGRTDALIIFAGFGEQGLVVNVPIEGSQFVIVVHFDGVKRAIFGAQPAVHANIGIDVEFSRVRDGPPGGRVAGAHDPDALRRADLGAARRTLRRPDVS